MVSKYLSDIYNNYLVKTLKVDTPDIHIFTAVYYIIELDYHIRRLKFTRNNELYNGISLIYDCKLDDIVVARYCTTGHFYLNLNDFYTNGYAKYGLVYKYQEHTIINHLKTIFKDYRFKYCINDNNLIRFDWFVE